jgi:ATP-dependent RNA helicase MSS116
LGFYKAHARAMRWSDDQLVTEANRFAMEALLCGEVPGLERKTVGKMGLKGARGLNIVANLPQKSSGGRGGGGRPKPAR